MTLAYSDGMLSESDDAGGGHSAARAERLLTVLNAAREVFVVHGYHGSSMDQISCRAGMSKPVIYTLYANKLDLYLAVLQHHLDRMVSGIRRALADAAGQEDKVRRAVGAYFDFVDEDPDGHVLIFDSPVPSEPSVRWRTRQAFSECAVLASSELRAAGMDDVRAFACAFGVIGASHSAAWQWLEAGRPIPKSDAVETTVALCWHGLSGIS